MSGSGFKIVSKTTNRRQSLISIVLIGLLAVIGVSMLVIQSRYDPSAWRVDPTAGLQAALPGNYLETPAQTQALEAIGFKPLSTIESYDAGALSDKINGKAELYLAAGFQRLETRRYALPENPGLWMERYIYEMDDYSNAFAVFSAQRRTASEPLDLTADAYKSANGLFFVHGPFYVEMIASGVSQQLLTKMTEAAKQFVKAHSVAEKKLNEIDLLPNQNRIADSEILVAENAFGIDGFNQVYSARYKWEQDEATGFITRRNTAEEAQKQAREFADYFLNYGGEAVASPDTGSKMSIFFILDFYEIVFSEGDYTGGVHEATDLDKAVFLAGEIQNAIREFSRAD
ncbi:MAG: hypothetical protein GY874_13595 [Desulfobacteraceae bacterium]|nr:hypothetical protein [Desulfobacteraceae bacterium]